jgi:hypothetical protein
VVVLIVRLTDRFLPLLDNRTAAGQRPFKVPPPALHLNLMVTGARHQPLLLRRLLDDTVARIDGLAILTLGVGRAATCVVRVALLTRSSVSPEKLALT